MECAPRISPSSICTLSKISPFHHHSHKNSGFLPKIGYVNHHNAAVLRSSSNPRTVRCAVGDVHKQRSSLESLFCYDKPIPEERIEKPVGLSLAEKDVGDKPRCSSCEAKGVHLCMTCVGSGLYVDSILESQGIIVRVRCLGCGGTGNTMCSECGGRGHI
ncbi:hypothetical protein ACS0TY_025092 [Phlomoides rotata]